MPFDTATRRGSLYRAIAMRSRPRGGGPRFAKAEAAERTHLPPRFAIHAPDSLPAPPRLTTSKITNRFD